MTTLQVQAGRRATKTGIGLSRSRAKRKNIVQRRRPHPIRPHSFGASAASFMPMRAGSNEIKIIQAC
jgi:hypothetical protein